MTIDIAYNDPLRDHLTAMSRFLLEGRGDGDWLERREKNRHYVGRRISQAERAVVADMTLLVSNGTRIWKDLP